MIINCYSTIKLQKIQSYLHSESMWFVSHRSGENISNSLLVPALLSLHHLGNEQLHVHVMWSENESPVF